LRERAGGVVHTPCAGYCWGVPNIRFYQATEGERLAYATDGEGPAILFPAWWISHVEKDWEHDRFRAFFSALAQHHLVVRYDRVGVGLSDRTRDQQSITVEREVADLERLIDHLGLDEVTLFGVSCGGPTAVTYAAQHPTRVRNIILHGSYLRGCTIGNPEMRAAMLGLVRASWGLGSKTLASIFTPDVSPDEIRRTTTMQRDAADSETAAQLLSLTYSGDVASIAPQIQVPCLVLHRHHDSAIPFDSGRELAANLPNATFTPLEGTAHTPWEGDTAPVLDAIFAFLGTGERAQTTAQANDSPRNALLRRGDVWTLTFDAVHAHLKHSKGLADLAALLAAPGKEIAAAALMHGIDQPTSPSGSDEVLDERARNAYRARLQSIDEDLEEAQSFNDLGRIQRLEQEHDSIFAELRAATGLGGRSRKLKDPGERARKAVTARIREGIERIVEAHPAAGEHFARTVRTGSFCCYEPTTAIDWQI
jgi:pimeloyl-ACP methyl ester carboxylesterase